MIRLQLSPEEYAYLEQTRRTSRSQVAERCHYVLLNASGCSVPQIAQRLERHEHTMRKWLSAYQEQGVMGLHNTPPPGRPPIQGTGLVQQLEIILSHPPSHYGYLEAGWTVDMIRDHLRQHDLPVSDATVRRRLQDGGWVYKRFAKTLPQKAPSAEQKKKRVAQIVDTIQELRHAQRVEVLFADESHWTNEPYVQRGWFRKGKKVKVPGPAKRQRTTLFGALHLSTQKMYWKRAPRGTSKLFIEFLHQLHQRFADALILLILDNAKIHKSRLVKRFVKQHDWIALEHLEPYSPEYNPIERFWKWLKVKVYGATAFATIEDVISKIRHLIWHYNEGWLTSTIHFVFEPYQEIL